MCDMFLDDLIYVLMTIHYFMLLCVSFKWKEHFVMVTPFLETKLVLPMLVPVVFEPVQHFR